MDVGPLFEGHWTGIPVVTAGIAALAFDDADIDWQFLYETVLLDRKTVERLLRQRSGGQYLAHVEERLLDGYTVSPANAASGSCIFPNVKAKRRFFGREALIVHDFSTLLTPEFHNLDTISHHAHRLRGDVETTDTFFCNSAATMADLCAYFSVEPTHCRILPLGISIDPADLTSALSRRRAYHPDPYVCVLGTIEPRKNGAAVLRMLRDNPAISKRFRVLFIGRDGWNDERARLMAELTSAGIDSNRIVFSGFVDERQKLALLLGSAFCIYPSFFEGYGLPIAEAAALGKHVVCSATSSMPEVSPDMCYFFDPNDVASLTAAFLRAEQAAKVSRLSTASFTELWPRIEARSWKAAYQAVRDWTIEDKVSS